MFIDDFFDLFVKVLSTFDQGFWPALSDTVEIFLLEADKRPESMPVGLVRRGSAAGLSQVLPGNGKGGLGWHVWRNTLAAS